MSGFKFTPVPITTTDKSDAKRTAILTYLNKIAGTTGWSATTNTGLQQLYRSFISMKAGSSADLEAAVKDLYFALGYFSDDLAVTIKDNIKNATYTENSETKKYVEVVETNKTLTFNDVIKGYPSDSDNLPDGAAVLSWGGSTFSYLTTVTSISASTSTEPAYLTNSLTSYVYPAPLYYWGHSEILTSEESKIDLFKDPGKKWDEIATATNFSNGNVITSKTRSIVLTDPVQYAVGRLDISVSASGGSSASLTDAGIGSNAQTVSANNLKLTGVLIGGQKEVDWKFEPTGTTEYTIYDNIEISQEKSGGVAIQANDDEVLNHTLVLESTGKVGNDGDVVNVALEFVNNDKDFLGADGIIPKGTKFYLVGALKAEDYKDKSENGYNGYEHTGGKVFKQDFITRAKFTIVSLKQAINTIPDLRNPKVEFGLSVNLEWQKGITFTHIFN
ncbi:MAG: hypothetical protein IJV33_08145 [Bacteroidaceae bacterium]|nr:hypothetical protein [Bacteroidaceae bacterium]